MITRDDLIKFRSKLFYYTNDVPREFYSLDFYRKFCKLNQREKIKYHLQKYGHITNGEANMIYSIRHIPSVIRDLRKQGMDIESEPAKGRNIFDNPVNYVVYTLMKED